ncbi:MAG: Phosphoglycerate kinase [Holosporales bacterium]
MHFKTLKDLKTTQEPIFVRADLNVPLKGGNILDNTRIIKFIPTVKELLKKTKTVIIATHLARPDASDSIPYNSPYSTKILASELEKCLGQKVTHIQKCIDYGMDILEPGVYLLENLRFYKGEEKNDLAFAKQLLGNMSIYVNDAFSCCHRAHASIFAITQFSKAYAGLLLEDELSHLLPVLEASNKGTMAIVGGSKISTKIMILENLLKKVDFLFVAGAMANTFLKAKGVDIGASLCEENYIPYCLKLLKENDQRILMPVDYWVGNSLEDSSPLLKNTSDLINEGMILDFGKETLDLLIKTIQKSCQYVLWNGPLGAYEYPPYDRGSIEFAKQLALLKDEENIVSIAGGGDTVAVLQKANSVDKFSFISTAGGAFLELLEGKKLPGIEALYQVPN